MGLFGKKEKKGNDEKRTSNPDIPELPKLPELPDFKETGREKYSQLPRFPNDSLGDKFSQNTIKEAVAGEKEVGAFGADEFPSKKRMMHQPFEEEEDEEEFEEELRSKPLPGGFREMAKRVKEVEPIFIRIDKFEESLHSFEKAREQIKEIEKMLGDVKKLKEEEEKEIGNWEKEVQKIKQEIEKIDQDIFSKVE